MAFLLLLALLILGSQAQHVRKGSRACDRGGGVYCSSNAIKGYLGPIDSAEQIKEALVATAFKNEVVLFSESRATDASQTLARFRNHGYSHIMVVLDAVETCKRLDYTFLPWKEAHGPISCGTYATKDENGRPYASGFKYLSRPVSIVAWWYKWYTAARAVALGYNVLAVDSDCFILDDFYLRVKVPSALANYNMFTQSEGKTLINSGWTYVQNAASNGPVAWMLFDMLHKLVRWTEDPSELFKIAPRAAAANSIWADDQESMSDVLFSCINGRTSYYIIGYNINGDEDAWKKLGVKNGQEHLDRLCGMAYWKMETFPVSGQLAGLVCEHLPDVERCRREPATNFTAQTVELRMPHSGGVFPLEWGGFPFVKQPGPVTLAYRQSFKDLGVPLPPDPEDPATEAAARATKPEHFVLLQSFVKTDAFRHPNPTGWVQGTWASLGRLGLWHTHLAPPGSHMFQGGAHVWAGMFPWAPATKYLALSAAGHYDWRVAGRLAGHPHKMFIAAQKGPEVELRRVVAYSPGLLADSITKQDFIVAVNGLAQLGWRWGRWWPGPSWTATLAGCKPSASATRRAWVHNASPGTTSTQSLRCTPSEKP